MATTIATTQTNTAHLEAILAGLRVSTPEIARLMTNLQAILSTPNATDQETRSDPLGQVQPKPTPWKKLLKTEPKAICAPKMYTVYRKGRQSQQVCQHDGANGHDCDDHAPAGISSNSFLRTDLPIIQAMQEEYEQLIARMDAPTRGYADAVRRTPSPDRELPPARSTRAAKAATGGDRATEDERRRRRPIELTVVADVVVITAQKQRGRRGRSSVTPTSPAAESSVESLIEESIHSGQPIVLGEEGDCSNECDA
ncbi:hypothetical protein BC940DRAFT_338077 [Gongronella butleri]|nr:hypothetical protein BC940DRAFT_338077 [Gongronella butleri]